MIKDISTREKIYAWKPAENLDDKFYMQSVTIDLDGFRVLLIREDSPKQGVIVDFYAGVRSYRVTDESFAMHLLQGAVIPYEGFLPATDEELSSPWTFFKVENSDYLKWASYQSDGLSEALATVHYVIWTEDWCIDILSCGNPEIRFIDLEDQQL